MASVCRTPLPVMLRHIGKSSVRSSYISSPASGKLDSAIANVFLGLLVVLLPADVQPVLDDGEADHGSAFRQHRVDQVGHVEILVLGDEVTGTGLEHVDAGIDEKAQRGLLLQPGDSGLVTLDDAEGNLDFVLPDPDG